MFFGSLVALVTPMDPTGDIDWAALESLIEFHVENGTSGLVVVGTTGESSTLDFDEHKAVIRFCVDKAMARISIIAGTGANSTREALHLTQEAKLAGADACLSVTPYYNKPTQIGLLRHYEMLADSVDIPQILYNVPGRTAVDLAVETVHQLARHPRIIGIKEATSRPERVQAYLYNNVDKDFAVYCGEDALNDEFMREGAVGIISVTANIAPHHMANFCQAARNQDWETANSIHQLVMPLHRNLFIESNPIPAKWALYRMGRIQSGIRLPLTELTSDSCQQLEQNLQQLELI
ncbi:MAG: 4-hydroxy-tetrahydrodipicolinate synthase [Pseudomonadota bacterium]